MEEDFLRWLHEVGYKGATGGGRRGGSEESPVPLEAKDLAPLFHQRNEATKALLSWLATTGEPNLPSRGLCLTKEEELLWNELKPEQVLEGEALEEALETVEDRHKESLPALKGECEKLEEELLMYQRRVRRLESQRDQLANVHAATTQRKVKSLRVLAKDLEQQNKLLREKLDNRNEEMNQQLEELGRTLDTMYSLHQRKRGTNSTKLETSQGESEAYNEVDAFLSCLSLKEYERADHALSERMLQLLDGQLLSSSSLSEDLSPSNTPSKNSSADTCLVAHLRNTQEIERLKEVYPRSEFNYLAAQMELARATGELEFVERTSGLAIDPIQKQEVENALKQLKNKSAKLIQGGVIPLLEQLSSLHLLPIFHVDCDLKLARQALRTSTMGKMQTVMMQQQAGHKVLSLMLLKELQEHQSSYNLLAALQNELLDSANATAKRMEQGPVVDQRYSLEAYGPNSNTIALLNKMLSDYVTDTRIAQDQEEQASNTEVAEAASHLMKLHREAAKVAADEKEERSQLFAQMEHDVQRMLALLCYTPDKAERTNLLNLSPAELCHNAVLVPNSLQEAQQGLEDALKQLHERMNELLKAYADRKKSLEAYPIETQVERDLFVHFFNAAKNSPSSSAKELETYLRQKERLLSSSSRFS
ncbi:hypothetical protein QOT17_014700 [Balamuthia mandrillaris]